MKQLIARVGVTALLAAGLTGVAATTPAYAGSWTNGPSGKLTLWKDDNYEGHSESRLEYDNDFKNDSCDECDLGPGGDFSDDASSVVNRTKYWWVLAEDHDQGGPKLCIRPNSHDSNLGNDTNFEDEITSVERRGTSKPVVCNDTTGTAN